MECTCSKCFCWKLHDYELTSGQPLLSNKSAWNTEWIVCIRQHYHRTQQIVNMRNESNSLWFSHTWAFWFHHTFVPSHILLNLLLLSVRAFFLRNISSLWWNICAKSNLKFNCNSFGNGPFFAYGLNEYKYTYGKCMWERMWNVRKIYECWEDCCLRTNITHITLEWFWSIQLSRTHFNKVHLSLIGKIESDQRFSFTKLLFLFSIELFLRNRHSITNQVLHN